MPRTAVVPTALVANGGVAEPAGTTIDATLVTNGVVVNKAVTDRLIIEVANTAGAAKNVIVRKGDNPPAWAAGQGDLTVQVPATSGVRKIGPLESGRFAQGNSDLEIDFESGTTGTLKVFLVPRSV